MKKWIRYTITVIAIVIVIFLAINFIIQNSDENLSETDPFIVANPLDLNQIKGISKFRSCVGHNYSGYNTAGELETYRTMKHYVDPITKLAQTEQQIRVFAPFDGEITQIAKPGPRGADVRIEPKAAAGWQFIFDHIDLLPNLDHKGALVTAGQHIGYANLINGANFDIGLKHFGFKQVLDSPFLYMTNTVQEAYITVGIKTSNIIYTIAERDAAPCKLEPGASGRDANFADFDLAEWVNLTRQPNQMK